MNCKDIIIAKLKELGADGLCCEECGCGLDDLFLCDSSFEDCVPAIYKDNEEDMFIPLTRKEAKI